MITVERKDSFHLKIARVLQERTSHRMDIFLFVPGELELNKQMISEDAFYHNAIHVKRTYYSSKHHLPLVYGRLANRGLLSSEQYRLSLSLYAYQYVIALERDTQALKDIARKEKKRTSQEREEATQAHKASTTSTGEERAEDDAEAGLEESLAELCELAQSILQRLRRNRPDDPELYKYYANIDNYLSWLTEQSMLALVAHLPRGRRYADIRERLLLICQAESGYREQAKYNSQRVTHDYTRMSNKMRLDGS